MGATLYEIGGEFLALQAALDESGGELTAGLQAALDALDLADAKKVDGYCRLIREYEARHAARKAEADRLAALAQGDKNAAQRLKDRLKDHLERTGRPRVETERFAVWVQDNGQASVRFDGDARALPAAFQAVKVEADAKAILAAWKADPESVPAGVAVSRGTHLRIR